MTDKLLILLALRAKLRELKPSITDYHRSLKTIFSYDLGYNAVRNRLKRLEDQDFLRSRIIRDFVKNDLADSEGVKLRRFTKVYKKIYAINVREVKEDTKIRIRVECDVDFKQQLKAFRRSERRNHLHL